ncbi:telomere-binding alpha subunit central domain-containing protein [Blumeria hordei DH14]|uniref:Telomere-binding alpha subunit central domain-containing protein n=1 Tax=Blumeria graminis f. sp. hordei (strain DH14) TaxID=546991 RepID=N1J5E5_BLUG1|nr:telomere-binding alpha subunit central domain-containing protein [Blumeria hordei DH14]
MTQFNSGLDWKCTLEITDHSIQPKSLGIKVVLFWPLENMPSESAVADIAVISRAKLQGFGGLRSLLSNINTTVHIMPSTKIPRNLCQSYKHLWKSCSFYHSSSSKKIDAPSYIETEYALKVNLKKSSHLTLSSKELKLIRPQANNVREKYRLVADARPGEYCDLVGQVVKIWRQSSGALSVYISDYSVNDYLYDYVNKDNRAQTKSYTKEEYYAIQSSRDTSYWPGPFGKLTIQIALWDQNADYINERAKCGDWLALNNVRMKLNSSGSILEGAIHSENGKVHVQVLTSAEESPISSARVESAKKRKLTYLKDYSKRVANKQKNVKKKNSGPKRKLDEIEVPGREPENRETELSHRADQKRIKLGTGRPQLNINIKSNFTEKTPVTLREILNSTFSSPTESRLVPSPFTNCKYKAIVRVIDYFPDQIEHFAVSLDDDEIDEPLGSATCEVSSKRPKNNWEWRFALLLEEASITESSKKECLWVVVDNYEAQHLLNLKEDATDLSQDEELLFKLKEQLFKLWGDLEEKKLAILRKMRSSKQKTTTTSQSIIVCHSPGMQPDPDSDTEKEKTKNQSKMINSQHFVSDRNTLPNTNPIEYVTLSSQRKPFYDLRPSNKAFTCCIQQYGIREVENHPANPNLEPKILWKRQYSMFGTKIA